MPSPDQTSKTVGRNFFNWNRHPPRKQTGEERRVFKYIIALRNPKLEETKDAVKGEVYTLGYTQGKPYTKKNIIALYVGKIFKHSGDMNIILEKLVVVNIPQSAGLSATTTA